MTSRANPLRQAFLPLVLGLVTLVFATWPADASSHREAPAILESPQVDATDFYMFRSYEPSREGYVTLIANYNPLQDPYGGPNYFPLDSDAVYDIHITNDGSPSENLTFRFQFENRLLPLALPVGPEGNTTNVEIPLVNAGAFGAALGTDALRIRRGYTLRLIRGDVDSADASAEVVTNNANGFGRFAMPFDNIGKKSIPNYAGYANRFIHEISIPGCVAPGRVFAGQRRDPFAVNLGEIFDLVNLNPLGDPDAKVSDTDDKNVTSLALEVPIACLTDDSSVIGGWTTASLPAVRVLSESPTYESPDSQGGDLVQVSRLGNPLVNEVAIGLSDKNLFNASHPSGDPQFLSYVTNPTLPELLQLLFGVQAPNNFPRNDLVWVFLTGIPGVNDDGAVGEYIRLNTAIAPTPRADQNTLGVATGDNAGYPNGRRPGDDAVDISLRAVMGILCHLDLGVCSPADAPDGLLPYNDGADQNAQQFLNAFPYVNTPIAGSPNTSN